MEVMLTIFTPTYNRANTLPRLYDSLRKQTCMNFEWLVMNDGSNDHTEQLFEKWLKDKNDFIINYCKVENGGKNRAINRGVQMAKGKYFFIVDSDDFLLSDAVSYILKCFSELNGYENFIGIATLRGDLNNKPLNANALIDRSIGYVDCNNLERDKYNLSADMAEVFFTEKLKKYPFPVWEGEFFTPESVVWDRMALDGYKLRWYNKVLYLCEYQKGGLSDSSWRLLRDNPMGYAMMFNVRLEYTKDLKLVINYILQYISCCFLADQKKELYKCVRFVLMLILLPAGWILSVRRRWQLKTLC